MSVEVDALLNAGYRSTLTRLRTTPAKRWICCRTHAFPFSRRAAHGSDRICSPRSATASSIAIGAIARFSSCLFTLVEPAMMEEMHMRIVGARYTTLAGEIAAQIVYVDEHGVPCTLYEARPAEKLANVTPGEHQVDGLRISLWKEKGLLMVLARPMA